MNDDFEKRVRAAAIAAWWVVGVAAVLVTLVWFLYLGLMSARPEWVLSLWGPECTWPLVQKFTLAAIVALKCGMWLLALGALWLTLWARQLAKMKGP